MFYLQQYLRNVDVSNWDTSKVTNMSNMFNHCQRLPSLDVSNWDTSSVTYMVTMFADCPGLKTIYASDSFVTSQVTSSVNMFA